MIHVALIKPSINKDTETLIQNVNYIVYLILQLQIFCHNYFTPNQKECRDLSTNIYRSQLKSKLAFQVIADVDQNNNIVGFWVGLSNSVKILTG